MQNKVLIIEDEISILSFLKLCLKKESLIVDVARDGREAMMMVGNNKYSLIISDLMLPFVSGFELIAKIRSDERNSETPILVVSANSSENVIAEVLSIGANDFLKKPLVLNSFLTRTRQLLEGQDLRKAV